MRVSSAAVEVPPVGDDQVEAVEVKVVVLMPFLEAKGHLQQRISPVAQNMIMIHWPRSKSSTHSCDKGTDDTYTKRVPSRDHSRGDCLSFRLILLLVGALGEGCHITTKPSPLAVQSLKLVE